MNKEVLDKLGEKILEWLNRGDAFLTDQIPDVIQQLLRWKFYEAVAVCAFALIGLLGFAYLLKRGIGWERENLKLRYLDQSQGPICVCVFSGMGMIAGGMALASSLLTAIQISVAPKVYLIEFIKGWLK